MSSVLLLNKKMPGYRTNFLKSLVMSGNARKTSWHYNRASKGHIVNIYNDEAAMSYAEKMDSIISVLKEHYPNNWDFYFRMDTKSRSEEDDTRVYCFKPMLVIRYEKFTITNQDNQEHIIKDLLVTVDLDVDTYGNIKLENISGTRGTLTYEEWYSGYRHSHLTSYKPTSKNETFQRGSFCLGDESPIEEIASNLYDNFDRNLFQSFCYALDSVVGYESIEGTPYHYIMNIGIGEEKVPASFDEEQDSWYYSKLKDLMKRDDFQADFVFSEGRYKIKHNDKFKSYIKSLIIRASENGDGILKYCLCMRQGENYIGYSFPIIKTREELDNFFRNSSRYQEYPREDKYQSAYTMIHGNKIVFKIEDFSGEVQDINKFNPHPKFLDYVSKRLEQRLYRKAVIASSIKAAN